eukprot:gb/GFBE01009063.1/.p1 GENE.gb/GFBE01009063.1/~~gb/GFBE01009063.1/.p1  ORF type:complete len:165 (+),score=50.92 gb/GFBE01009063.1/:1-495(+)
MAMKMVSTLLVAFVAAVAAEAPLDEALASNDECQAEGCALNALQHRATEAKYEGAPLECTGEGAPAADTCYSGSFLIETLKLRITEMSGGHGKVDMWAKGQDTKECLGKSLSLDGQKVTVESLSSCGLPASFKYDVLYCENQDEIQVAITVPFHVTIPMRKVEC